MKKVSPLLNWTWFEWVIVRDLRDWMLDHGWSFEDAMNWFCLAIELASMMERLVCKKHQAYACPTIIQYLNNTSSCWSAKLYLLVRELKEKRFRAVYDCRIRKFCVLIARTWIILSSQTPIHPPAAWSVTHRLGCGSRVEHTMLSKVHARY